MKNSVGSFCTSSGVFPTKQRYQSMLRSHYENCNENIAMELFAVLYDWTTVDFYEQYSREYWPTENEVILARRIMVSVIFYSTSFEPMKDFFDFRTYASPPRMESPMYCKVGKKSYQLLLQKEIISQINTVKDKIFRYISS